MTTKPLILLSGQDGNGTGQNDCDCDCACVGAMAEAQDLTISPSATLSIPTLYRQPFTEEYCLLFNPEHQTVIAVLNRPAMAALETFQSPRTVGQGDDVFLVRQMLNAGLLQGCEEGAQQLGPSLSRILSAWLHLTDRCNLRCSYCYLPHVQEDMSIETGLAAVDAAFRAAVLNGYQSIKLKYAGGEPLLSFPLIPRLHSHAARLAEKHRLSMEEVILSDGTLLTGQMAETLKSLGIRLMVSMDGIGSYHDRQRSYVGGRGSFKDVSGAVNLALSHGLVPTISVTVSRRTAGGLPSIMEWVLARDLPFSLNFYRENDLSASYDDLRLDEKTIIAGMRAAFKVIESHLPYKPFLNGMLDRAGFSAAHTHACGAGQNYLVFEQHGRVAKCQMHLRQPVTDVHAMNPLTVVRADQTGIRNVSVKEKDGCKTCEWKHWCAGGCPLATYRAMGRYDVRSPNCSICKVLFPEALRLEGLRLIRDQGAQI